MILKSKKDLKALSFALPLCGEGLGEASVIIFVKFPEKGKVKTRLAKTAGEEFAVNFYKKCTEHTFSECEKLSSKIKIFLFFNDEKNKENIEKWTDKKFCLKLQKGKDLGEKMYNAFDEVFKMGKEKVVIIGTDLPDITSDIIENAFDYLNEFDSVIGPSSDGGYYLLGLKKLNKEIFTNISWSTKSVFDGTIKKIKKNNFSYKILPELSDIDTEEDFKNWIEKHPENKSFA